MSKAINPFKPTAGMNPPELIGRDAVLDDFAEALENGPGAPDRLMRISGVRGTGKTVLLNALGDLARKKDSRLSTSPQMPVLRQNSRGSAAKCSSCINVDFPINFRSQPWLRGAVEVSLSSGRGDVRCREARWFAHHTR